MLPSFIHLHDDGHYFRANQRHLHSPTSVISIFGFCNEGEFVCDEFIVKTVVLTIVHQTEILFVLNLYAVRS